jgi:ubiquinone biosynthesis protein
MQAFRRFFVVCRTLILPFIAYEKARRHPGSKKALSHARAVRLGLQSLGITFIKLGQLLATRPDIVGEILAAELRNLLDNEPAIPFTTLRTILKAELPSDIKTIFASVEREPLGSASIAQVHKAQLLSGKLVALKIQRPGVMEQLHADLPELRRLCRILDGLSLSKSLKFTYLYNEFISWITNELDFQVEGRRADVFRENMKPVEGVVIPQIYWKYTTKKLLIMSYAEGYTLNELLDLMAKQRVDSLYELKLDYAIDPDVLIERIVAAMAKQTLVDKYFHGDLHPANIIVKQHNVLAFIDFGIIGTLNEEEHKLMLLAMSALVRDDPQALTNVLTSLIVGDLSAQEVAHIHQELADELHRMHEDASGKESLTQCINAIFRISQRYEVMYTQGFIIAMKTITQMDSVASQIGLRSPLVAYLKPAVEEAVIASLAGNLSQESAYASIAGLVEAGKKLPQSLVELEALIHAQVTPRPLAGASRSQGGRGSLFWPLVLGSGTLLLLGYVGVYASTQTLVVLSFTALMFALFGVIVMIIKNERN